MKTVEDIEKEYNEFVGEGAKVLDPESLDVYLDFDLKELEKRRLEILKEQRSTYFAEKLVKMVDLVTLKLLDLNMDYFAEYKKILDDMFKLELITILCLSRMQELITKDNFQELFHLVRFIEKYNNETLGYYESEKRVLESSFDDFVIENYSDNDLEAFNEFCVKKLDQYSPIKGVEKIKQI